MESRPGDRTKWQKFRPFFLLALAIFLLFGMLDNPRIAALHGGDILRLVAIGLLIGVSLRGCLKSFMPAPDD